VSASAKASWEMLFYADRPSVFGHAKLGLQFWINTWLIQSDEHNSRAQSRVLAELGSPFEGTPLLVSAAFFAGLSLSLQHVRLIAIGLRHIQKTLEDFGV
jgi:hypothetical protein